MCWDLRLTEKNCLRASRAVFIGYSLKVRTLRGSLFDSFRATFRHIVADHPDSWIEEVAAKLLACGARTLSLDEVGDALGDRVVGADEVEKLLRRLKREGARIDSFVSDGPAPLLKQVIGFARELREQGHAPSPSLIAARSGLTVREVRVALLYFDVIKLG